MREAAVASLLVKNPKINERGLESVKLEKIGNDIKYATTYPQIFHAMKNEHQNYHLQTHWIHQKPLLQHNQKPVAGCPTLPHPEMHMCNTTNVRAI